MKLKGLTKLALSGVALAAVAATLGTSTYAWYVSNSTATVNGITGGTNTDVAGSLLLNKLSYNSTSKAITADTSWTNSLAFGTIDANLKASTALVPTSKTYTTSEQVTTVTGWHNKANAASQGTPYGYLMFGAQQSDSTKSKVTMTFGIANTTGDGQENPTKPSQTVYYCANNVTPGTGSTPTAAGQTFSEDFVYALKFDVTFIALSGANLTNVLASLDANAGATLAADSFKALDLANDYTVKSGYCSNGNAHEYYKHLSTDDLDSNGNILGGESVSENTTNSIKLNFASTDPYLIVIRYWLDGADPQCFDSTINQTFELKLKMEATAPANNETGYYK